MNKRTEIVLVIGADEPALFFCSTEDAEAYLEPIDVENDVYTAAYGPDGQLFDVTTDGHEVRISSDRKSPKRPQELRLLLERFMSQAGVPFSPADSIEALIARCEPYAEPAGR